MWVIWRFRVSSILKDDMVINNEIQLCKVLNRSSKEKLENVFLKNRVSYFVEWQDKSFWSKVFGGGSTRKISCIIKVNEADAERARDMAKDIPDIILFDARGREPIKTPSKSQAKAEENSDTEEKDAV